jgi:Na+-transporting NADH:ubiquinone oxidoreductase subunit A
MFISGKYDASRMVSINGNDLKNPTYVKTYMGANVGDLLKDQLQAENLRIVSGDPLSGKKISQDGYLNFHDDQVCVLEEGDDYEMFGWLLPITPRPSASGTFPNFLFKNHAFEANTNTHGEPRAFVVTGQYEEVLPMDIYPQQLMKAVLNGDIEKMEGLGINELTEEDLAICEFVCTSKMPLQSMLREGLDMMREQA